MNVLVLQFSNFGFTAVTPYAYTPRMVQLLNLGCGMGSFIAQPVGMLSNIAMYSGRFSERFFGGVPTTVGSYWNANPAKTLPSSSLPMLANVFQDAGYATGLFGKHGLGHPFSGQRQNVYRLHGYDTWRSGLPQQPYDETGTGYDNWLRTDDGSPEQLETRWEIETIEQEFIPWWTSNRGNKFARVSFCEGHGPHDTFPPAHLHPPGYTTGGPLHARRRSYEAMMASMDAFIGRAMQVVDLSSTVVLMVSDCGTPDLDVLVRHLQPPLDNPENHKRGCKCHGVRVPAIVIGPTIPPRGIGMCDELVSCADVAPTLVDLAGLNVPPQWTDGVSQRALLEGTGSSAREFAYAAIGPVEKSVESLTLKLHVERDGSETLYDKTADPMETAPLVPSAWPNPGDIQALRAFMANPAP